MHSADYTRLQIDQASNYKICCSVLSMKRSWRQLSRFQRLLLTLFVIIIFLTIFYLLMNKPKPKQMSSTYTKYPSNSVIKSVNSQEKLNPVKQETIPAIRPPSTENEQSRAILRAMNHSWAAYKTYAWGFDEVHPLTKSHSRWMGLALTMIDSLDTLWLMNMKAEFKEARDWIKDNLNFESNSRNNVFETTIRILGGLLSAYEFSKDDVFLDKARDLGDRLMSAFQTNSGIPVSDINLQSRTGSKASWTVYSSLSEVTSTQLEFNELSRITANDVYGHTGMKAFRAVQHQPSKDGLLGIFVDPESGRIQPGATITLGARGDSYYEYLLKLWIQSGKKDKTLYRDYIAFVNGVKRHLLRRSKPNGLVFVGELLGGRVFSNKMDELVCFLPGTLAYGTLHGMPADHLELAKQLVYTCFQMFNSTATGLAPEIVYFNTESGGQQDIIIKAADTHYLQRPETLESLFYMYRITGDIKYKNWAWSIFQAAEKYTKVQPLGYVSISDVTNSDNVGYRTKCESFWLAESLKYLYLIMDDNASNNVPLKNYVFNTEAHPFPIRN